MRRPDRRAGRWGWPGPLLPPGAIRLAARLLPPIVFDAARRLPLRRLLAGESEWAYVPEGWRRAPAGGGWNDISVVETQKQKWPAFLSAVDGTGPLAVAHELPAPAADDYIAHNILMTFGYVLALAAKGGDVISLLDWGSGIGHYYVFAGRLLDGVRLDYHGRDVPLQCAGGREVLPQATFHDDDSCFGRTYDLVFASSSLQYVEDWRALAARLARSAGRYLYLTRLPTVFGVPSFVVRQQPHSYGYRTAYLGWFINRDELVAHVVGQGMVLVREFLVQEKPFVPGAPEQCEYRGYLFRQGPADDGDRDGDGDGDGTVSTVTGDGAAAPE